MPTINHTEDMLVKIADGVLNTFLRLAQLFHFQPIVIFLGDFHLKTLFKKRIWL